MDAKGVWEMPLSTILVEDSPTIRDILIPAMAELADVQVIAIAETASEALLALEKYGEDWDLAVVDPPTFSNTKGLDT